MEKQSLNEILSDIAGYWGVSTKDINGCGAFAVLVNGKTEWVVVQSLEHAESLIEG